MTLAEKLLATRQAQQVQFVEQAAPKGWKAGTTTVDGTTTVTTLPYLADEDPKRADLLKENGWDPEKFRIVGPIRNTSWTAYVPKARQVEGEPFTFMAKAYRFSVVERTEGELSIDELVAVVNKHVATSEMLAFPQRWMMGSEIATMPATQTSVVQVIPLDPSLPYVAALGDLQIGKVENPTEELLKRVMELLDRAAEPLKVLATLGTPVKHVHLAWLGDCIEGMNSQMGRLRWRTTLTVTEQVRVLRRLMLYAVEVFAPLTERLTMVSIPGNHDEANTRDMDTRIDDSWAVEALNMVADALSYNEQAFGHVECYVPGPDNHAVVMDVGGTTVAHTHGHEHPRNKHFSYWAGQALGSQPMGQAHLWLQGHGHHFQMDEDGDRKWIEVPALERESVWWRIKSGTAGSPGLVTFQLGQAGEVRNLNKLQPQAA